MPARAGYWVGVKTNAASPLTRPLRAPGGEFREGLPTTLVRGFPLTMVDLEADPAQLVDALRVPLPGLENLLERLARVPSLTIRPCEEGRVRWGG